MKQLFLVDESLSPNLVIRLKELGYIAKSVRDIKLKGADDIDIVKWAIKNNAVIIAGDLDFGELWYWHYHGKLGMIILRVKSYKVELQYEAIKFLHDNKVLAGKRIRHSLVISTNNRYRIR